MPTQNANRKINRWLYDTYIAGNPSIPAKVRDGVQLLNNLLETSPIRPVTPVGQLLFNEQKRATENAIFHKLSPQAALRDADETVQRQLDRALSPPRGPLVPWRYFIAVYLGLIALCGFAVYWWETRPRHGEAAALEGARSRYFRSQWRGGWLCASPWIIGFIVLTGGPILFSIVISFCDFDILNPARFVGLANYHWMFAGDPLFWKAAGNTAFMILGIPSRHGAQSRHRAAPESRDSRRRRLAHFFLSAVDRARGRIEHSVDLDLQSQRWLAERVSRQLRDSRAELAAGRKHQQTGAHPDGPLERRRRDDHLARRIERDQRDLLRSRRASMARARWQKFRHVTLPLLSPYIFFNLIMGLIGTLQIFTQAFIMTQGGPVIRRSSTPITSLTARFVSCRWATPAALGWILFLVVFGLTLVQLKFSKRWVHYESD